MTCVEFAVMLGAAGGGALGAGLGFGAAGWVGACLGLLLGAASGILTVFGLLAAGASVAMRLERRAARRRLRPHFARYWTAERTRAWRATKETLRGGETVRGSVVARFHYGRFIDIGCGFPTLLTELEDSDRAVRRDDLEIDASVLGFDDFARTVVLTRRAREWLLHEDAPVGYAFTKPAIGRDGTIHYRPLDTRAHQRFRDLVANNPAVSCALSGPGGVSELRVEPRGPGGVRVLYGGPLSTRPSGSGTA